jgi:hypothetical protein
LKANQEKIEAIVEHYKEASHVKAIHLLTGLEGQASDVLRGDSKGAMYRETNGAPED